jgi:hypothetical protein
MMLGPLKINNGQSYMVFNPSVSVSGLSSGFTKTKPLPLQFGNDWVTIGQGVIQSALTQNNGGKKQEPSFNWKNFFTLNLLGTTTVAIGLAYSDVVYREALFGLNRYYGHPLEQHQEYDAKEMEAYIKAQEERMQKPLERLPEAGPTLTVNQMIRMVRETKALISSKYLYQMAKAGLVKEIHTPLSDKAAAPGVVPWNAVLMDGTVVKTEMDLDTRDKLITELKIPIRHPSTGLNIGWLEASLLAAVMVNGLSQITKQSWFGLKKLASSVSGNKIQVPGPTEEDKKIMALYQTGRLLVATILNVSAEPLSLDMLESRMGKTSPDPASRPITQEELKQRLVVLMAGPAVERKQNDENLTVNSSGSLSLASRVASLMVLQLGMGEPYGRFVPTELPTEERKKEVEANVLKIFQAAEKQARDIIDQYSERLEPLQKAVTEIKGLTRNEILSILEGKTAEDIKKQRSYFYKLKQRWFAQPPVAPVLTVAANEVSANAALSAAPSSVLEQKAASKKA